MFDEPIRQRPGDEVDEELDEEWIRETDEPSVRNVGAFLEGDKWHVSIWAAEFVREEPLESRMRGQIAAGFQAAPGVTNVSEGGNREEWFVTGSPTGSDLVRAAADVIDPLSDDIRRHLRHLAGDES
jgi:hypothetical protein